MKSREQKKLQGTLKADRDQAGASFDLIRDVPSPPDRLNDYAQSLWFTLTEQLIKAGILQVVHLPVLAMGCHEMGKYWMYEDMMKDNLGIQITSTGYEAQTAAATQSEKAFKKAMEVFAKFGFNPLDGQKIKVDRQPDDSDPFKTMF